jgi:hypothetical protein
MKNIIVVEGERSIKNICYNGKNHQQSELITYP